MYPLKFLPNIHDKIWGGNKLETIFFKDPDGLNNIGESWEISGHPSSPSVVMNGFLAGKEIGELIEDYKEQFLGKKVYEKFKNNFPLLFKFIDADQDLSIQVHPNDECAKERHNSFGKTEMWYVVAAEPDAYLTIGFEAHCSKEKYLKALKNGKVEDLLKKVPVEAGDVFFIPAGMVHAIGKGILVAEIQESSDITYRIYDYNRTDANGQRRELHTEQALGVIDFSVAEKANIKYEPVSNQSTTLVKCDYFRTNLLSINKTKEITNLDGDSFIVYMCLEGGVEVSGGTSNVIVNKGETVFIPASIKSFNIVPLKDSKLLEVSIP